MNRPKQRSMVHQTIAAIAVLAVLCVVAAGVYFRQFDFNPAVTEVTGGLDVAPTGGEAFALDKFAPAALVPFGPPEKFEEGTLSQKINGKAELYLKAGFERLHCRRFAPRGAADKWIEVFVYDMGESRNAFAVYSQQRRSGAEKLDLGDNAYRTGNAVYFTRGPYYVEIVATAPDEELTEPAMALARNFASQIGGGAQVDEKKLFPTEGLDASSMSLISDDAFGFSRLDNVFTADYTIDGGRALAFVSVRRSASGAGELARAYAEFLVENGGIAEEMETVPGATMIRDVFDMYEVVFARGRVLAGVHQAPDKTAAADLAEKLDRRLEQISVEK